MVFDRSKKCCVTPYHAKLRHYRIIDLSARAQCAELVLSLSETDVSGDGASSLVFSLVRPDW